MRKLESVLLVVGQNVGSMENMDTSALVWVATLHTPLFCVLLVMVWLREVQDLEFLLESRLELAGDVGGNFRVTLL